MVDGVLVRLGLPVMSVILAGLSLGVVVLGVAAGLGGWSLALLVIPGALGAVFLLEYRQLPYEPWHPGPRAAPAVPAAGGEEEEFVDPVEEADRLDATEVADAATDPPATPEVPAGSETPR